MKLYKIIAVLVAFIIASTAVYLILNHKNSENNSDSSSTDSVQTQNTIFAFDYTTITDVYISNDDGEFELVKDDNDDDAWNIVSDDAFEVNPYYINEILYAMEALTASTVISDVQSLQPYGFETSSNLIRCTDADGSIYALEIGNANITNTGYYVKKENDDSTVYTIDTTSAEALISSREKLQNTYLFDVSSSEVNKIVLTRGDKTIFDLTRNELYGWYMAAPIEDASVNSANVSTIIASLVRVEIASYVEENVSDLSAYGLDNPSFILDVDAETRNDRILFSSLNEETNEVYAYSELTKDVVSYSFSDVGFINLDTSYVLITTVHAENIYDVSNVDVNFMGEISSLQIDAASEDDEDAQYIYNGTNVSAFGDDGLDLFEKFFSGITGIYFSTLDLDTAPPEDYTADITITYTRKSDPETVTVEYVKKEENTFYAIVDGEYTGFVVRLTIFYDDLGYYKTKERLENLITANS